MVIDKTENFTNHFSVFSQTRGCCSVMKYPNERRVWAKWTNRNRVFGEVSFPSQYAGHTQLQCGNTVTVRKCFLSLADPISRCTQIIPDTYFISQSSSCSQITVDCRSRKWIRFFSFWISDLFFLLNKSVHIII